jgi:hypothetical protein
VSHVDVIWCGNNLHQWVFLRANIPETMAFAITRTNMGIRCNNHLINLIWLVVSTCFTPLEIYESHWGEEMCQTTNRATDSQKSGWLLQYAGSGKKTQDWWHKYASDMARNSKKKNARTTFMRIMSRVEYGNEITMWICGNMLQFLAKSNQQGCSFKQRLEGVRAIIILISYWSRIPHPKPHPNLRDWLAILRYL